MTVLALDIGDRRIGIAISDPTELLARPLSVLVRRSNLLDTESINRLVVDNAIRTIVVGLPTTSDGQNGSQVQKTKSFARHLRRATVVPIAFQDERYSTVDAMNVLVAQNVARARRRVLLDAGAAAIILDEWLTAQRTRGVASDSHSFDRESRPIDGS
jgi:putative Holliday junction resolvase